MRVLLATALTLGLTACVNVDPGAVNGAGGYDRNVTVVNSTKSTMTAFYGSNSDAETWEENILNGDNLEPGYSVTIDFEEGNGKCVYDFRAEFADGGVYQQGGVNVCKSGKFEIAKTSN